MSGALPDGCAGVSILVLDARGAILECNSATGEVFGYTAGQLTQMNLRDLIHPDDLAESSALFDDLIQGRRKHYEIQNRFLDATHQVIWAIQNVFPAPSLQPDATTYAIAMLQEQTRAEHDIRALSERLITAQEEERRNIARELHDDLSQEIAAVSMLLARLENSIPEENRELRDIAAAIRRRGSAIADRIRHVSRKLHPALLEYAGIAVALKAYAAEFGAVNNIAITVDAQGLFADLPPSIGLCLYRVTQEALQNVAKHSHATSAIVSLQRFPDAVTLTIRDSGRGFPEPHANAERGLGLISMSERVRLVHGALDIHSTRGEGTTISVSIPF